MPDTITAKESTAIAETIENYFLAGEAGHSQVFRFFRVDSPESPPGPPPGSRPCEPDLDAVAAERRSTGPNGASHCAYLNSMNTVPQRFPRHRRRETGTKIH